MSPSTSNLQIRQVEGAGVDVPGLRSVNVTSREDVAEVLNEGKKNKVKHFENVERKELFNYKKYQFLKAARFFESSSRHFNMDVWLSANGIKLPEIG